MAVNEIHKNDIGTQFLITIYDGAVVKDISYTTSINIIFRKPSGLFVTKVAHLYSDGTDGKMYYNSVDGDLDEVGFWKIQAQLISASTNRKSDVGSFIVHENLE